MESKIQKLQKQRERWMMERQRELEKGPESNSREASSRSDSSSSSAASQPYGSSRQPAVSSSSHSNQSYASGSSRQHPTSSSRPSQPPAAYSQAPPSFSQPPSHPQPSHFQPPQYSPPVEQHSVPFPGFPQRPSPPPEQLVDRLTEKIAERLKNELKEELMRENQLIDQSIDQVSKQMQQMLTSELQSHSCPICFEIMRPPEQAPILLFPCGHSFCARCITQHAQTNRNTCPYCRERVDSMAVNRSLQAVIESFLAKQTALRKSTPATAASLSAPTVSLPSLSGSDNDPKSIAENYVREYRMYDMRCRVLLNERQDTEELVRQYESKSRSMKMVMSHLQKEEAEVLAKLEQIQAELALVRSHITDQEKKISEITEEENKAKQNLDLVNSTLDPLLSEREKARVMIQSFAPELLNGT
eukprot:GILI01026528.1.p1 GENE.GILI01026528.1~~GILI01026528.1.p1  ORF type:complete len:416 (+),score=60.60 GILI01026528.1:46-1293(+)